MKFLSFNRYIVIIVDLVLVEMELCNTPHVHDQTGKIACLLKEIADLEEKINDKPILFVDTKQGWQSAA